jgi:hypothetical protein
VAHMTHYGIGWSSSAAWKNPAAKLSPTRGNGMVTGYAFMDASSAGMKV